MLTYDDGDEEPKVHDHRQQKACIFIFLLPLGCSSLLEVRSFKDRRARCDCHFLVAMENRRKSIGKCHSICFKANVSTSWNSTTFSHLLHMLPGERSPSPQFWEWTNQLPPAGSWSRIFLPLVFFEVESSSCDPSPGLRFSRFWVNGLQRKTSQETIDLRIKRSGVLQNSRKPILGLGFYPGFVWGVDVPEVYAAQVSLACGVASAAATLTNFLGR